MLDPFSTGRCCLTQASELQQLTADYYEAVNGCISNLMTKIYQAEVYGRDTEELYNQLNNFHYLYSLLIMIYLERQEDIAYNQYLGDGCAVDNGAEYYVDKYHIECIVKKFMCTGNGCDIGPVLDVFGLNPKRLSNNDGIGFMYIQYGQQDCDEQKNIFRVS